MNIEVTITSLGEDEFLVIDGFWINLSHIVSFECYYNPDNELEIIITTSLCVSEDYEPIVIVGNEATALKEFLESKKEKSWT